MDRLELALERARQNRAAAEAAAAQAGTGDGDGSGLPASQPGQGRSREIDVNPATLESHRVVARQPMDRHADLFRILRTKVQQLLGPGNLRAIGITSPNYGDGKTLVAVNLALSLALDVKQHVCLVDLNLRNPAVHRCLDIGSSINDNGLTDYLRADIPLSQCLVRPPFDRLVVLPAGMPAENSSELLATPKMAALAKEMRARYTDRVIIYDLPPVLPQDDTIGFLPNLDGVIVVLREGETPVDDLKRTLHALGDTMVLGTVLNRSTSLDGSLISAKAA